MRRNLAAMLARPSDELEALDLRSAGYVTPV